MHRGQHGDHVQYDSGPPMTPRAGHNQARPPYRPTQWQVLPGEQPNEHMEARLDVESDFDLVTAAFIEGFIAASDPTSFLRLARVPFEAHAADGTKLSLLRVEINDITGVGGITPYLGGASFCYEPLPGRMASRRKRLRLVYFDAEGLRALDLADAMRLSAGITGTHSPRASSAYSGDRLGSPRLENQPIRHSGAPYTLCAAATLWDTRQFESCLILSVATTGKTPLPGMTSYT